MRINVELECYANLAGTNHIVVHLTEEDIYKLAREKTCCDYDWKRITNVNITIDEGLSE